MWHRVSAAAGGVRAGRLSGDSPPDQETSESGVAPRPRCHGCREEHKAPPPAEARRDAGEPGPHCNVAPRQLSRKSSGAVRAPRRPDQAAGRAAAADRADAPCPLRMSGGTTAFTSVAQLQGGLLLGRATAAAAAHPLRLSRRTRAAAMLSTAASTRHHPGNVYSSARDAIGNTPLIRLRAASEATGRNIYGKCEYANAAGGASVKARAAKWLLEDAEARGLEPGGIICEATAGNTGIALCNLAAASGYRAVIVIPSSQSQEKKDALRFAGAQLVEVPPRPMATPNFYVKYGERLAAELGAIWIGQFDNVANRRAHVESTAPEIYRQLEGAVHGFSCAVGTGGTLAGVAEGLRAATNGAVKIALTDPCGARLVRYFNDGELAAVGDSITEGIGQGRVTGALGDDFKPDFAFEITDDEALRTTFDLCRHEGLSVGMSSGINVAGAMRLARELPAGANVVTVLCDDAARYKKKLSPEFLKSKDLPYPDWLPAHDGDLALSDEVVAAAKRATVQE